MSFGLSLFVIASIFYRFTGSIFNPSVSLALFLTGVIKPLRFLSEFRARHSSRRLSLSKLTLYTVVCTAQMVGGIVAAAIVYGLTPGELKTTVALAEGVNRTRGLFIEAFGTAALTLNVLMLAAGMFAELKERPGRELSNPVEKNKFTPFAPLGFGVCLMVVMLFAIQFTGGSIK